MQLMTRALDRRRTRQGYQRTALSYFCKGQACAALEVDVVGEDEGAESTEGFAREEVGFAALWEPRSIRRGMRTCIDAVN